MTRKQVGLLISWIDDFRAHGQPHHPATLKQIRRLLRRLPKLQTLLLDLQDIRLQQAGCFPKGVSIDAEDREEETDD